MSRVKGSKVAIQFTGLLFCMLLVPTAFAVENATSNDVCIGNVTNEKITSVPIDTESGYYQGTVESKIELQTTDIYDYVEVGKDYKYQIKIKNIATKDITIDPKLISDNYGSAQAFSDNAIEIFAPSTIKAGEVINMTIVVHVPENTTGSYNGNINMNVNENETDESTPQISLGFYVWQQPTIPYVKTFNTSTDSPITIEVSYQDYYTGLRISPEKETTAVEIGLTRDATPVNLTIAKLVESSSLHFGSSYPIWALENRNAYQEEYITHVETYQVPGAIGNWKLSILPKNMNNLGYSLNIGRGSSEIIRPTTVGTLTTANTNTENINDDNATKCNETVIYNVTESDNGKCLYLKNGQTFYLELRENPSTGYSWQLNLSKGLLILSDNYTQNPAPSDIAGVGGTHLWIIKAVTQGSQQVKGIYKRPSMNTTGMEENFTLNVEVI